MADQRCQTLAQQAGLSGSYKSWISGRVDTGAGPLPHGVVGRFAQSSGPYVLVNGTKVADNWADLTDGSLDHAIDLTEQGTPVGSEARVWTNTTTGGQAWDNARQCAAGISSDESAACGPGLAGRRAGQRATAGSNPASTAMPTPPQDRGPGRPTATRAATRPSVSIASSSKQGTVSQWMMLDLARIASLTLLNTGDAADFFRASHIEPWRDVPFNSPPAVGGRLLTQDIHPSVVTWFSPAENNNPTNTKTILTARCRFMMPPFCKTELERTHPSQRCAG